MNESALAEVRGPVVVACAAPYGVGGMGRHLQELVDFFRARGLETKYFTTAFPESSEGTSVTPYWVEWIKRAPPIRFSVAWQGFLEAIAFDRAVARLLPAGDTFVGFNGQALRSIGAARRLNFKRVLLAAATPHVKLTVAQARKAWDYAPVEPLGYVRRQHQQFLREYELADQILYATEYVRKSFLDEGVRPEKLTRFNLTPHPRFTRRIGRQGNGRFRIVSIGSLNLVKGIAVLLDAFERFDVADSELTLVGGSGTSQMRKYLHDRMASDERIRIAPGDPLPCLRQADVCVHAAFQDGFAYAPMEALACGVPVIVTEHTGMKEYVREGDNGFVVPAGDPDAIATALHKVRRMCAP